MKNVASFVLLPLLALAFCLGEFYIDKFFPLSSQNYYQWLKVFFIKEALYDAMFFIFSLVLFWNTKGGIKAMCVFLVCVTGGSAIDKVIFNINQRLWSDIVLVIGAIILSFYLYKRWTSSKRGQ